MVLVMKKIKGLGLVLTLTVLVLKIFTRVGLVGDGLNYITVNFIVLMRSNYTIAKQKHDYVFVSCKIAKVIIF